MTTNSVSRPPNHFIGEERKSSFPSQSPSPSSSSPLSSSSYSSSSSLPLSSTLLNVLSHYSSLKDNKNKNKIDKNNSKIYLDMNDKERFAQFTIPIVKQNNLQNHHENNDHQSITIHTPIRTRSRSRSRSRSASPSHSPYSYSSFLSSSLRVGLSPHDQYSRTIWIPPPCKTTKGVGGKEMETDVEENKDSNRTKSRSPSRSRSHSRSSSRSASPSPSSSPRSSLPSSHIHIPNPNDNDIHVPRGSKNNKTMNHSQHHDHDFVYDDDAENDHYHHVPSSLSSLNSHNKYPPNSSFSPPPPSMHHDDNPDDENGDVGGNVNVHHRHQSNQSRPTSSTFIRHQKNLPHYSLSSSLPHSFPTNTNNAWTDSESSTNDSISVSRNGNGAKSKAKDHGKKNETRQMNPNENGSSHHRNKNRIINGNGHSDRDDGDVMVDRNGRRKPTENKNPLDSVPLPSSSLSVSRQTNRSEHNKKRKEDSSRPLHSNSPSNPQEDVHNHDDETNNNNNNLHHLIDNLYLSLSAQKAKGKGKHPKKSTEIPISNSSFPSKNSTTLDSNLTEKKRAHDEDISHLLPLSIVKEKEHDSDSMGNVDPRVFQRGRERERGKGHKTDSHHIPLSSISNSKLFHKMPVEREFEENKSKEKSEEEEEEKEYESPRHTHRNANSNADVDENADYDDDDDNGDDIDDDPYQVSHAHDDENDNDMSHRDYYRSNIEGESKRQWKTKIRHFNDNDHDNGDDNDNVNDDSPSPDISNDDGSPLNFPSQFSFFHSLGNLKLPNLENIQRGKHGERREGEKDNERDNSDTDEDDDDSGIDVGSLNSKLLISSLKKFISDCDEWKKILKENKKSLKELKMEKKGPEGEREQEKINMKSKIISDNSISSNIGISRRKSPPVRNINTKEIKGRK